MISTVEVNQIDVRYAHLRLQDSRREKLLQSSILEQGILDPLYVVGGGHSSVLLDGFKRYRCASKLGLSGVPVVTLDDSEVQGMLKLIRLSSSKGLSTLEEAGLVDELHRAHGLSCSEIARRLERSLAWVSLRLGLLSEMSENVRRQVFSGRFPVRNYMYTLRGFTRVKGCSGKDIDEFVSCVSGNGYGTRDIDCLADGYFNGGPLVKRQIREGNLDWTLRQLKEKAPSREAPSGHLSELESRVLSNLEMLYAYMVKLSHGLEDARLQGPDFFEQGRKAAGRILQMWPSFHPILQGFHEKAGAKRSRADAA